tara:strand:+ start:493 stop:690 length:198 start_codon:yes stop_codon:yes gene_type:complete
VAKAKRKAKSKPKASGTTADGSKPKNAALYARVKAAAKKKFKVFPSAYASSWIVREYKKRGGTYG